MGSDVTTNPAGKGCWYETWYSDCPVCGRSSTYRERRWTPRPERWEDRNHVEEDKHCASNDVAGYGW